MEGNLKRSNRRSIRYPEYDYTQPGAYFVTMVTYHRECVFGKMIADKLTLNTFGIIVTQTWEWLAQRYSYIDVFPYIVTPNHIHGILQVHEPVDICRGGSRPAPTNNKNIKPLGQLIGAFKTRSAKEINLIRNTQGLAVWQRNYYEHIIRNQAEMEKIALYILANPDQWSSDPENIP
jgi:putative transposase